MLQRRYLAIAVLLLTLTLAACSLSPAATPTAAPQNTPPPATPTIPAATPSPAAGLANPASENCVKQGGTVSIQKNSDGSEYGLCIFPDGKQCEEWAMLRGECPVGGIAATPAPAGNTHTAEFDGVKIAFDDQLAQSARGEDVAAVPVTEGPALGGGSPAMVRFVFGDATAPDYLNPYLGQVMIYKTAEWEQLDPAIAQEVADLKNLLATKPTEITGSIPVLPPIPAAQVFHVKPQYLDFKGGSGVGFVTYYSQAVNPITAKDLFYTFQGLTTDGQYYVVVYHPVTTALLPEQSDMDSAAYDEYAKNYEKFLADLVAQLNELPPSAYTPDLTLLDQLVESIEIGAPTFGASSSAAGIEPLSAEVCNDQAQAMSQAFNGLAVTQSTEPLFDPATGKQGTGCQATITGTGEQFQGPVTVVQTLGALLIDRGFTEDMMLAADGPTGTAVGYRKDDQMCMAAAMWEPDASANCPKDQPIAACELTPAQKNYTVSLTCGVEAP